MNTKILKDLNFAEKINSTEAVTEAGKDMLRNYRGYLYSNAPSCGIVNGFIAEAKNFSFDTGLVSICESVLKFINENNISWKLASACESILSNNSNYNYIAKVGVEQVGKLLEMNEADVVSYIKAGVLKNVQYIPEFRNICKEVYKTTVNEVHAANYTVTSPISYVMIGENKEQYFQVAGRSFKIENDTISEAQVADTKFNRINALLESFSTNDGNIEYTYKGIHGDECKFTLNENGLTFTKGSNISESFETPQAFMEYVNIVTKPMNINEKLKFTSVSSAVAEVFEAMDSVVVLDCVNLMNCNNGTILAISEAKNNVNLTVIRSINAGTSSKNYDYMVEALKEVTKLTGVDLKFMFEARIDEDCKKQDPEEYKQIKEQLEANKDAQMDIRKKKIAMLAEQYKNDPARITLLNKVARELSILENK